MDTASTEKDIVGVLVNVVTNVLNPFMEFYIVETLRIVGVKRNITNEYKAINREKIW
jgi:hypothetical protein